MDALGSPIVTPWPQKALGTVLGAPMCTKLFFCIKICVVRTHMRLVRTGHTGPAGAAEVVSGSSAGVRIDGSYTNSFQLSKFF